MRAGGHTSEGSHEVGVVSSDRQSTPEQVRGTERESISMTSDQISAGVTLRIIAPRWDRPQGTIARVNETGALFVGSTWWFTVEWLTYLSKRGTQSLRMFEEDLSTFELLTGPIVIPLPMTKMRQRLESQPVRAQASLPFTKVEDDD